MKFLLTLLSIFCFCLPAHAQSTFDTISKKFPEDAKYFAEDILFDITNIYPTTTVFNFEENKKFPFNQELTKLLTEKGYTFSEYGIKIDYLFDFIDEQRAYLRLLFADGKKLGVVRVLGDKRNALAPLQTYNPMNMAYSYQGQNKDFAPPASPSSSSTTATEQALNEFASNQSLEQTQDTAINTAPIESTPLYPSYKPANTQGIATIPLKTWKLEKGSLMHQLDELCQSERWKLVWNADYDLDMHASASFSGSFVGFIEEFFTTLQDTQSRLRVSVYKSNKVIEVSGE